MKKSTAEYIAFNMVNNILKTDPSAIIYKGNDANTTANYVADFIKTLSTRLATDCDDQRIYPVDKS